jgi:hypothetical protein
MGGMGGIPIPTGAKGGLGGLGLIVTPSEATSSCKNEKSRPEGRLSPERRFRGRYFCLEGSSATREYAAVPENWSYSYPVTAGPSTSTLVASR